MKGWAYLLPVKYRIPKITLAEATKLAQGYLNERIKTDGKQFKCKLLETMAELFGFYWFFSAGIETSERVSETRVGGTLSIYVDCFDGKEILYRNMFLLNRLSRY